MQMMGAPIMSNLIFQGFLLGPNVQLIFKIFLCVPLVLDMVLKISVSHHFLVKSLLGLFLG